MSESGRLPTVSRLPYERPRCRHWRSQQGGKIMAAALPSSPPTWFRIVALLAVLWNAFGVAMYLSSVGIFGDPMAGLSAAESAAASPIPSWITRAFAIGPFAGLIGRPGLVTRRGLAVPVLTLSLVVLVV